MAQKKDISLELLLAIVVAFLLIITLVFQKATDYLPRNLITLLIILLIIIKIVYIIRRGGTVFEDYMSLSILIILAVLRYLTIESRINTTIVATGIFAALYSVGIIPSIKKISKSENISSFIISYIIVIIAVIFLFSGAYASNNDSFTLYNEKIELSFNQALYFSTMTFTTVGYGDISPLGLNRIISSIEALTGIILNIGFIGYILASKRFRK